MNSPPHPRSVLATLRRLRSLALWVIVCVVAGPSAAAVCVDDVPVDDVPVETPPCHEGAGETPMHHEMPDAPVEPSAPSHHGSETACLSACCAAPGEGLDVAPVTPTPTAAVVLAVVEVEAPAAPVATAASARAHPPPGPTLLDTRRLRI